MELKTHGTAMNKACTEYKDFQLLSRAFAGLPTDVTDEINEWTDETGATVVHIGQSECNGNIVVIVWYYLGTK